jgi:hypothetical protein
MKRREFIAGVGGAGGLTTAAHDSRAVPMSG